MISFEGRRQSALAQGCRRVSSLVMQALLAATVALLSPLASAKDPGGLAKATLTTTVTGASCYVFTPGGASSQVPCEASGWDVTLAPGQVAQMFVQLAYAYADDGLSFSDGLVDVQCSGAACAYDPGPSGVEHGLLSIGVACSPDCSVTPYPVYLPVTPGADSFSGVSQVVHVSAYGSTQDQTVHMSFFADAVTVSAVTPVPEPATWLMLVVALPLMWGVSRSRRRPRAIGVQ